MRRESPGYTLASAYRSASTTHALCNPGFAPRSAGSIPQTPIQIKKAILADDLLYLVGRRPSHSVK